jgi:hypothetical protein
MNVSDINPVLDDISVLGKELFKHGMFIAGGAIWSASRKLPINDIDVFCTEVQEGDILHANLCKVFEDLGLPRPYYTKESKFAYNLEVKLHTGPYKLQIIKPQGRAVGSPLDVVNKFDLKNVQVYIDSTGDIAPREHVAFLKSRTVHIGTVSSVPSLLRRIDKYTTKGLDRDTIEYKGIEVVSKALFIKNHVVDKSIYNHYTPDDCSDYEGLSVDSCGFTIDDATRYLSDYLRMIDVPVAQGRDLELPW